MKKSILTSLFVLLTAIVAVAQPAVSGSTPSRNALNVTASSLEITGTSPAAYDFQHPVNSGLSITFNETVVLSSLGTGVSVSGSVRGSYTGTWSGASTVTFTTSQNFIPGEQITVTVGTSVTSLSGASLDENFTYTFAADSNPLGLFLESVEFVSAGGISDMIVTDITNNGNPDVVLFGYDGDQSIFYIRVITSDGLGSSVATTTTSVDLYTPQSFLVADFNNDGNKDVIILDSNVDAGGMSKAVSGGLNSTSGPDTTAVILLTGNGDGTFNAPSTILLPFDYEIRTFTSGDLNGNGNIDLVFPRETGNDVIVALGNGNGTFAVQTPIATPGGPVTAKLADINLDGILDLLTGSAGLTSVAVRYGNGDGTFGTATTYSVGFNVKDILIADFDNDGNPDLAVLDRNSQTQILLNNGVGGFTSGQTFTTGYMAQVIDFNGDSFPDLLSNYLGTSVYINNGDGTFGTNPRNFSAGPPNVYSVLDMTGNGSADIVASNSVSVFVLESAEPPDPPDPAFITSSTPSRNAVNVAANANINVVFTQAMDVTTLNAMTISVVGSYRGAYTGVFSMSNASTMVFNPDVDFLPGEVITTTVTTGAKNTSALDIARPFSFSFTAAATGYGLFTSESAISVTPGNYVRNIVTGDFNGDGHIDFATISTGANTLSVVLNNGDGSFAPPVNMATLSPTMGIVSADFNGDGLPDLAVSNNFDYSLSIFMNQGNGNFADRVDYSTPSFLYASEMVVADMDGDGRLDIVQLDATGFFLFTFPGVGDGTFGAATLYSITQLTQGGSLAVGDYNRDWRPDIVVTDFANNNIRIYENDGAGSFLTGGSFPVGTGPASLALVSLEGNGFLDAAVANTGANTLTIRREDLGFAFFESGNFATGNYPISVHGGDLDGDGDLDLLVANNAGSSVSFVRNRLTDSFPPSFFQNNEYALASNPNQAVLADMNGDGRLDILTANNNGTVSILYNYPGPEIASVSPLNNATNVSSYADIVIEFSVDGMDLATMNATNIQVLDANDDVIPSTFNFVGRTLTITPNAPFQQNTNVSVTVTANVKTSANLSIINPTTFSFQVAESFASIVSVSPAANALHGPSESVSIEFADDMNLTSIENGVQVIGSARGAYSGTWGFNSATKIATFTPTLDFVSGEAISVIVGTSVETPIGGFLEEQFQWSFMIDAAGGGGFLQSDAIGTGIPGNSVVKVADMNGDGIVDIVAMGYDYLVLNKSIVTVSLNDGIGGYEAPVVTDLGTDRAANITVADFDNDGNADIAVVHRSGANMVSFHFGDGLGGFGTPVTYTVTEQHLNFLAAGDLNGDGLLDLAVTRYSSSDVVVLRNNGDRTFTPQTPITSGGGAWGIQIVDVNNDGHLDVVTADWDDGTISVLMNNGNGTFASKVSYNAGSWVTSMAAGDVNGDGFIDIVADDEGNGNLYTMLNDGTGAFTLGSTIQTDGYNPSLVKTTGDGNLDLVAINSGNLIVFESNGDGTFNSSPKLISVPGWAQSFSSLDMDGDNEVDLVALSDDGNTYIMLNVIPVTVVSTTPTSNALNIAAASTITATFSTNMNSATFTTANMPVSSSIRGVLSGTYGYNAGTQTVTFTPGSPLQPGEIVSVTVTKGVESSGNIPMETAYHFSFTVAASGFGNLVFADALSTGSVYNYSLYSADVDGDGDDDLIAFSNGAVKVYKNNAGVFSEFSSLTVTGSPEHGILGDFNNNGHVDVAYRQSNNLHRLQNDGTGIFTAVAGTFFVEMSTRDIITADFDNDGNLDIAHINGNQLMNIAWGNGDFTFPSSSNFTTGPGGGGSPSLRKLSSGDINNNGQIDIVGYESSNGSIVVMRNNGGRSFSFTTTYSTPSTASDIALVDLSGNGNLDIVITPNDGNFFSVLAGNGDGTFGTAVTYGSLPYKLQRVTPFDFTGNGAQDLVFFAEGSGGSDLLFIAYNDGNGGFGNQISFEVAEEEPDWFYGLSSGYAVLDANNDGALDIASRLSSNGDELIGFILNTAPSGGGSAPTVAASASSTNNVLSSSAQVNWTNGDGQRRFVVLKAGGPVDATLADNSAYGPNPTFGAGAQVGAGNYFVYGGNGSSATISGLTAETTYHYAIFEINGFPGEEKILTAGAPTGSFTTTIAPPVFRISEGSITFSKADNADWTLEANQDRITDYVWITRKNTRGPFNIARETAFDTDNYVSPIGTLWSFGTADDIPNLTFKPWREATDRCGECVLDGPMVMYLVLEQAYIEVEFTSFTGNENGGGFSYIRGDGVIPGIPTIQFDEVAGYALSFDGVDDYTYFETYDNDLDDYIEFPAPLTFEMWVKPLSLPNGDFALITSSRSRDLYIGINADHKFFTSVQIGPSTNFSATGLTTVEAGKWYHLAVSAVSNGELRLYVNAELDGSVALASSYKLQTDWINLGGGYVYPSTTYGHFFHGEIDEYRLWRQERTSSQIRSTMFSAATSANIINASLYWQMNEGTGTQVVDLINGYNLSLTQGGGTSQPTWVTSTIPFGGVTQTASGVQSGTATVGGATLTFNTPFTNPVDVFFNEITTAPNLFPTGFTTSLGGKYFVIDLVGDPGTFSLDLTLTFGAGVITEVNEASPSMLKLYRRSSGSTGEWAEIASASSAIAATGVVTWPGITSFSEFMAVEEEIVTGVGIENTSIVIYDEATYTFDSDFFAFTGAFDNATLTVTADVTTVGTLFVDANENGTYEIGTDLLLEAGVGVSYTSSSTNALIYIPNGLGSESVTLTFSDGTDSDQVTLSFTTVVTTPTLSGVSGENGWYLLANPLNTPLSTLFSTIWTQGAENSDAPAFDPTLYTFNQTTSAYEAITGDLETTTLPAGTGILAFVFAFDNPTDGIPEGGGWPKTLQNQGNPFGQTANVTLLNVDGDGDGMTSGSEGFALLGNPFGWNLSASAVITKLKAADPLANSYVYRWNPVLKRYQLLTSGAIQPYESVFVRVISSAEEVTLNFDYADAMNVIAASKEVAEEPAMIPFALEMPALGLTSEMALRFDETGAAGIDPFDGYYLGSYARSFANLYMGNGDQALVINNLPLSLATEETYPVYLHTTVSGEFTLTWDATMLPEGWEITLEAASGAVIDLRTDSMYTFNSAQLAKVTDAGESLIASRHEAPSQLQGQTPLFMLRVRPVAVTSLDGGDLGLPAQVELAQNYPNPFNPTTMIRFGVPEQAAVRLEVYDMLGRRVSVLVNNEVRAPGRYQVPFDGARLASGVYIYRLVVGEKVITRRMVLIK